MAETIHRSEDWEDTLDSTGEAEWQRLRQQLEFSAGFWLGFLFSPSQRTAAALRWRAEQILKFRALRMRIVKPSTPDDLRAVLAVLFEQESAFASCVWIEAIHSDPPTLQSAQPGPWTTAWDDLLLRINERRDALRRHLSGGLVLVAPQEMKARARDAAPDLWSVRSLVIDLQPSPATGNGSIARDPISTERYIRDAFSETAVDVEFALAEAQRIEGKEDFRPETLALVLFRAIEGLLEQSQIHDAMAIAQKTLAMMREVPNQDSLVAEALQLLSQAEEADNDLPAAASHITETISLYRRLSEGGGDTPQNLRSLSLALNHLGNIQKELQDIDAATITHEEEVRTDRLLFQRLGETPQAVRDLSVSLNKLGDVRREAGELTAATAAYDEALLLSRRLLESLGETPQAVRDLSVSLNKLGDVRREAGELTAATAAYDEALVLRRRLLESLSETPQAVRDLSVSLNKLGDVRREAGELTAATAAYDEALAFQRSCLGMYDKPLPQVIQDLIASIRKLENIHSETGNNSTVEALSQERQTLKNQLTALRKRKSAS